MSLWGATVITNLLSAIPVFGQDLVELTNITNIFATYSNHINLITILPTIGKISPHAFKNGRKEMKNKNKYLLIPYSFISFIVGLIDGDGYIQITKTTRGYIAIKLIIGLHLKDISTLEYIISVLQLGKLQINRDHKSPNCK